MPKSIQQISADKDKASILALDEGRLVNHSERGYFAHSLVGQFPTAVKRIVIEVIDTQAQEDGAWVSPKEAEAIAARLREGTDLDIAQLLIDYRATVESQIVDSPQMEVVRLTDSTALCYNNP